MQIMEASQRGGSGGSGGEERQIHIVYFLSRKGIVEQPHLLNFHFPGIGIRLRDVKRSLAELRGKDMPESFAWSYKRKYKYGCYVWQDLIDEDLITPISNNEYVLKGSQISSSTISTSTPQESEKFITTQKGELLEEPKHRLSREVNQEPKMSCEIEEESPKSTLTDDSMKSEEDAKNSETGLKDGDGSSFSSSSSSYLNLFKKKPKKTTHGVTMKNTKPSSSEKSFPKSKSHGNNNGASQILRSLINCRTVNTKDSVIEPSAVRQLKKLSLNNGSDVEANKNESSEVCRTDDKLLSRSQRSYRKYPWDQPQNGSRKSCDGTTDTTLFCSPRTSVPTYMPVSWPNCSQCGRKFKPEKLHSHMKSCKGIKASAAKGTKPANPPTKSAENPANVIERCGIHA